MGRESHRGTFSEVKAFGCFTLELVGTKSLGTGVAERETKEKYRAIDTLVSRTS